MRTFTTSYVAKATKTKPETTIIIHSVREPPEQLTLNTGHGKRKFEASSIRTRLSKVIIVASTKGRKKAVTEDELEEIEGLEDIDIEDDEDLEIEDDEDVEEPEDEDEDEDEEPAPKAKKSTKRAAAKPKVRDDGLVGTTEVAAEFGVDSRTLRMVLRKHSIPKNADSGRYEWEGLNDKTVVRIGKLIAKGEAKAVKTESLNKLKEKKEAEKVAATKSKSKTKKAKKVVVVDDDDEDED